VDIASLKLIVAGSVFVSLALGWAGLTTSVRAAIDIVIQLTRFSDGRRRMTAITEVAGMEGEQLLLTELFQYRRGQASPEGMVGGYFEPSGQIPAFYESLRNEGQTPDLGIFQRANPT